MWENLKHTAKTLGVYVTGKTVSMALTASLLSFGLIGAGFYLAIPIGIMIAGFINHMDHRFDFEQMKDRYRDEVAARLNKNPANVTNQDLQKVADGSKAETLPSNPILKEATDRIHAKHMASFLATVVSGAIAISAGFMMSGALAGIPLAAAVFGVALVSNELLSRGATRFLHLNAPTMQDRINTLAAKRGKVKEFEMFRLAAEFNPGLANQIKTEFGVAFDRMSVREKVKALEQFSEAWSIPQITEEFNHGIIRDTELTFALVGQSSGVPKQEPPKALKERAEEMITKGKDFGHSVWLHLKVKNKETGKDENKLVICRPKTGCATLDPHTSEKLLPLLEEQQRLNNGESAKSFTGRYLQNQVANDIQQQRS